MPCILGELHPAGVLSQWERLEGPAKRPLLPEGAKDWLIPSSLLAPLGSQTEPVKGGQPEL